MNIIVAADENWAIGNKGDLLVRIPSDHKHFREETTGKVVVLGRRTLETFPQGMPLQNRTNIILTHDPGYRVKGALTAHSVEELMKLPQYGVCVCPRRVGSQKSTRFSQAAFQPEEKENKNKNKKQK